MTIFNDPFAICVNFVHVDLCVDLPKNTQTHSGRTTKQKKTTYTPSDANHIQKNTQKSSANGLGHKKKLDRTTISDKRQANIRKRKRYRESSSKKRQMRSQKGKKTEARRSWT
jgi:hypothetical protein